MERGHPILDVSPPDRTSADELASATRSAVVDVAREVHRAGLTVGRLGNVSLRAGARFCVTPTRVLAADLSPEHVVVVGLDGRRHTGGTPSRELPLHLEVYRRNPSVRAIVHTHSPWATAWSHLESAIPGPTEELSYYGLRRVPCAPWAPAGSRALARRAVEALDEAPVVLLARHGVVAVGETARDALELCALAEQQAHVRWLLRIAAAQAGGACP
jgi:L-fuculose-phosphate aldolase